MTAVSTIRKLLFPLICLGIFSSQSGYAAEVPNLAGAIVSVKGTALIDTAGTGARHPAKPGDSIFAHDVVMTAAGGAVKILLKDHSVIDLGAATVFRVDQYNPGSGSDREVVATLSQGTVRGAVTEKITGNGKFHLKTPTATMGVRGTEFVVDAPASVAGQPPQASKITVLQGEVEVTHTVLQFVQQGSAPRGSGAGSNSAAAPKLVLSAGQQITASATAPMPTRAITLSAAVLGQVSAASKVADNTFSRSVIIDTASSGSSSVGGGSQQNGRSPASDNSGGEHSILNGSGGGDPLPPPPPLPPQPPVQGFDPLGALHPVNTVQNGFSHVTINIH